MIDTILAPLDGSAAAEAGLAWAARAATRCGAAIHLCTVLDLPGPDSNGYGAKAEDYLRSQAALLEGKGLTARYEVTAGPAAETILARAEGADLTVMTYGTSRWLFGGVLDRVLQKMTQPLVVVRATPGEPSEPAEAPEKVLVPLDSATYSSSVLPVARRVASALGGSMVLVHVIAPIGGYRNASEAPPGLAHAIEELLEEGRRFLAEVTQQLQGQGVAAETAVAIGDAAQEINRIALSAGAGLIAMATRGRDRLERRIVGSVANDVLQSSRLPCLLIRSNGDA